MNSAEPAAPSNQERERVIEAWLEGHGSWADLEAAIQGDDIPENIRADALKAIPVLSKHLGVDFIAHSVRRGSDVALEWITNHAPWTRQDLTIVAHELDRAGCLKGSRRLIARVRDSDNPEGALYEISLAARALDRGLKVELEPPTAEGRRADMRVFATVTDLSMYVEATTIPTSAADHRLAEAVFDRTHPLSALGSQGLVGGSRYMRLPDESEIELLYRELDHFWDNDGLALATRELRIPGLLVMWRCRADDFIQREHFRSLGYPDQWSGPPVEDNPFRRIGLRVADKLKQLNPDRPGIIVVKPAPLSFLTSRRLEDIAADLSPMVSGASHVNAVVLHHVMKDRRGQPTARTEQGPGYLYLAEDRDQIGMWECLVAWNPTRQFREGDDLVRRLFEMDDRQTAG